MSKISLRLPALVFPLLFAVAVTARAELPIIAKARAYLGPEAALNAVETIHYVGQLTSAEAKGKGEVVVDIIFKAPYRQRIVATSSTGVETTALDSYDGWQREQSASDPTRWSLTLLTKDQIKSLRANTWQNLAFFRGIEREGGKLVDEGDATIDGVACRKISFVHDPSIIFVRYFDKDTGRLVLTETQAGGSIREQGEIGVAGIRFPKSIVNTTTLGDGTVRTVNITFTKITVNESIENGIFAVPPLSTQ